MRHAKRREKSLPFCSWLSLIMKKLRPKRTAKMPYILPESKTVRMLKTTPSQGSVQETLGEKRLKCSTEW